MTNISALLAAEVERELAELKAFDDAVAAGLIRPSKRRPGSSISYSVRLDPDEVTALERRAAVVGLRPSVLARNLIRVGLMHRSEPAVGDAMKRLEAAVADLRGLVL